MDVESGRVGGDGIPLWNVSRRKDDMIQKLKLTAMERSSDWEIADMATGEVTERAEAPTARARIWAKSILKRM